MTLIYLNPLVVCCCISLLFHYFFIFCLNQVVRFFFWAVIHFACQGNYIVVTRYGVFYIIQAKQWLIDSCFYDWIIVHWQSCLLIFYVIVHLWFLKPSYILFDKSSDASFFFQSLILVSFLDMLDTYIKISEYLILWSQNSHKTYIDYLLHLIKAWIWIHVNSFCINEDEDWNFSTPEWKRRKSSVYVSRFM